MMAESITPPSKKQYLVRKTKNRSIGLIMPPTSYSSVFTTLGAEPGPHWELHDDRPQAIHVEPLVAFVAQQELSGPVAGPALLADHVAVALSLHHRVLGLGQHLRDRLVLSRLRRRWRYRPPRRPAEPDEFPGRCHVCLGGLR